MSAALSTTAPNLDATARDKHAILRGIDARDAERPASEVLSEVRWEGAGLDPDLTPAAEFLSWL